MAVEIERKFLLKNKNWKNEVSKSTNIEQAYLNLDIDRTVRVRIKGKKAFLTIKGRNEKTLRQEFEYEIPVNEAKDLLKLCHKPFIQKKRHEVLYGKHVWEIDEFYGDNEGLIVAEIELNQEDEAFEVPNWLGKEVSNEERYYNASLINYPFNSWK